VGWEPECTARASRKVEGRQEKVVTKRVCPKAVVADCRSLEPGRMEPNYSLQGREQAADARTLALEQACNL
jgi:hypothetical protein